MFMTFIIVAFIWTTHPTVPLGIVASNQTYNSLEECENRIKEDKEVFMAGIANHIVKTSNPPISIKKIYRVTCMTPIEATRLNLILGHK